MAGWLVGLPDIPVAKGAAGAAKGNVNIELQRTQYGIGHGADHPFIRKCA
jgi:hypothetical protein